MSINRFKRHLYVLPEDERNRQIATGFEKSCDTNQIQVLNEARGWSNVCSVFELDHVREMNNFVDRYMVLLVDFDQSNSRIADVHKHVPLSLANRVFVLGVWSEPEDLRRSVSASYEVIGEKMASDCRNGTSNIWGHPLLVHNATEIARICVEFRSLLFR